MRPSKPRRQGQGPDHTEADPTSALIVGRHPVMEALRNRRPIAKIWVQVGSSREGSLREIIGLAREARIPIVDTPKAHLDGMAAGLGAHQGVAAAASSHPILNLDELLGRWGPSDQPMLVLLDGIQDPHNFGAILRVAEAAGVGGVIIPERRAVGFTPVVDKSSAGASEYVPVARVVNMVRTIEALQAKQFFVFAADPAGTTPYTQVDWRGRVALVIGGEGKGIRPLVRSRCDGLLSIPMAGRIQSLNASAAAAAIVFEMVRQRSKD